MTFDEFNKYATIYIRNVSKAYQIIHLLMYDYDKEPEYRERIMSHLDAAAQAFLKIDHIVTLYTNRVISFGSPSRRVDVFNVALAQCDFGGCGIMTEAVSAMGILVAELKGLSLKHPGIPIEELQQQKWLDEQELKERRSQKTRYKFKSIWGSLPQKIDHDACFILMPFNNGNWLQDVYENHVKKVVSSCGLRIYRADDIFSNREVVHDIWEAICTARLIIADVTGRNPNVFYELGIAHTLGKDAIIITQSDSDVPFDLRQLRYIRYIYTPPGMEAFEQALKGTIVTLLRGSKS